MAGSINQSYVSRQIDAAIPSFLENRKRLSDCMKSRGMTSKNVMKEVDMKARHKRLEFRKYTRKEFQISYSAKWVDESINRFIRFQKTLPKDHHVFTVTYEERHVAFDDSVLKKSVSKAIIDQLTQHAISWKLVRVSVERKSFERYHDGYGRDPMGYETRTTTLVESGFTTNCTITIA